MQYYEVENSTDQNIDITLSGVTYKIITIPSNRTIVIEKTEDQVIIDSSNKLQFRQIP